MTETGDASSSRTVEISVVVGSIESERSIRDCLDSISIAARGRAVEVIVVDASRDKTAALVRLHFPRVTLIPMVVGTLTPRLWLEGYARSSGTAVAFTIGHCVVPPDWLVELQNALSSGAAGAGGPIALATGSSLLDAAVYFLRYSAFMREASADPQPALEIAGDNSMYVHAEVSAHLAPDADGFWEVDVNRRLRKGGGALLWVPRACVSFGRSAPLRVISRHRFAHGKHSGSWRSVEGSVSRWRIILAAPLVPFVLLARIYNRVHSARGDTGLVVRCAPLILWLAACWAAGEAVGAATAHHARRN